MGLSFTIAAGPRQRGHSQIRAPRDSWPYFTLSDSRLPQLGGPGPRIYIRQGRGGPVIPPGTGFQSINQSSVLDVLESQRLPIEVPGVAVSVDGANQLIRANNTYNVTGAEVCTSLNIDPWRYYCWDSGKLCSAFKNCWHVLCDVTCWGHA
jgi:hypothetical protein